MNRLVLVSITIVLVTSCNQNMNKKTISDNNSEGTEQTVKDIKEKDEIVLSKLWSSSDFINKKRYRYRSLEKAYEEPDSVINLALYTNYLGEVPENIDTFKNMQLLGLDYNDLTQLPASIANLTYLQKIHLNKNKFKAFPEVLTQNRYLKTILISDNEIETVSPDIKNLIYLEDLVINDNKLSVVPAEIFELQNLKVLGLRGNGIGELPDKFDQLVNLEKLNLQGNNLKEIPESITKLNLTRLTLKGNPMDYAYVKAIQKKMPNTDIEF